MYTNQSSMGPNLSYCSANFSTMYYASQYFSPNPGMSVHTIARYEPHGRAGMIAFDYGHGNVFLSSPHPEYEEDSDRDDTDFGDDLDDPDSEWDLLLKVSKWLIDASDYVPTSTTTTTMAITTNNTTPQTNSTIPSNNTITADPLNLPLIAIIATGGILIVLIGVVFSRRTRG